MSLYEHGRILAVNRVYLGSELVGDHAAGVTTLLVEDPVDFDELGGWLSVNDQLLEYTSCDDETGELTLATALPVGGYDGDRVYPWDTLYRELASDTVAQVELDGEDDNADPIEATVAHHLVRSLEEGIRALTGESVLLELDGDEWRVVDVRGATTQAATSTSVRFMQDRFTVATGTDAFKLTYLPITNSEHLYWHPGAGAGIYQTQGTGWYRTEQTVHLTGSPAPAEVGDVVTVEYAYNDGAYLPPDPLGWGSGDWSYLQIDPTDTVDRSAVAFDDSTWAVSDAAFGSDTEGHPLGWPAPVTTWDANTALWIRKHVYLDVAGAPPAPTGDTCSPFGCLDSITYEIVEDPEGRTYAYPWDDVVRKYFRFYFHFTSFEPDHGIEWLAPLDRNVEGGNSVAWIGDITVTIDTDTSTNPIVSQLTGDACFNPGHYLYGAMPTGCQVAYGTGEINSGTNSLNYGVTNPPMGLWWYGSATDLDGEPLDPAGPLFPEEGETKTVQVSARVDDKATIYWNGVALGSTTGPGQIGPYTVTGIQDNVIAARGEDTNGLSYLDVAVVEVNE